MQQSHPEKTLLTTIDHRMDAAIADGTIPGGALLVSMSGEILHAKAYGYAHKLPDPVPMTLHTLFDLSSLTKVIATTSAVMLLIDEGQLNLDDTVSKHIPGYSGDRRELISIADLLIHAAGLPAWKPLYKHILEAAQAGNGPAPGSPEAREALMKAVRHIPPNATIGKSSTYSDLGFVLLTNVIENITGSRLDTFCEEAVFANIGLKHTFFLPHDGAKPRRGFAKRGFAATEFSPWLKRYLVGEVHDENAHVMGGVSGHAGLFSTVWDVHDFALNLLHVFHGSSNGKLFSQGVAQEVWRRRVFSDGSSRAYGWDVPARENSTAGSHFSSLTFGHLGFTGTSVWVDAAREIIVVLLTNRVHPSRDNDRIRQLRPDIHDLIMEKLLQDRLAYRRNPIAVKIDDDGWNVPGAAFLGTTHTKSAPKLIQSTYSKGIPGAAGMRKDLGGSTAIWVQCKNCREIMFRPALERNLMVCPRCDHHHYMSCIDRIEMLADPKSFEEYDTAISPADPLGFVDKRPYKERLKMVQKKRKTRDAFRSGRCTIESRPIQIGVFDFEFMGGSMGSVVGEKVTRVFERATKEKTGAIVVSASGGARMQEGVLSLMQMAKSCAALAKMKEAGLPYISILVHPTTGGVAASFAMLGDVNIAEPKALIGFAGPRVIEQTIRQKLPAGFQRAEYLLEHGMVDMIVDRKELRSRVSTLYGMLYD